MPDRSNPLEHAAYGGPGWQPRVRSLREEAHGIWGSFGIDSEYGTLRSVLLHRPGPEIVSDDPNGAQMLDRVDADRAGRQHDAIVETYRANGTEVHLIEPPPVPRPNQMFMADLFAMTPEGAILARPASEVRAGEERVAAAGLVAAGVPILRSISGTGTFEGADLMWLSPGHVLIGRGLRTNAEAMDQIVDVMAAMNVAATRVDLPIGTMHLMGMLRILDRDLAVAWPTRLAVAAVEALEDEGYEVHFLPDHDEAVGGFALNGVTLGPRRFLMAAGNPVTQSFYEALGVTCAAVEVDELAKASGAIGCLTGVVSRSPAG
ncbi:MAG: amidinotransferase [Acidimicrobiaceae bacterium]|jgi:N-dimethylarginine dimethylaminohydrolase|nr:amidinotransferase [Acidimicrobiaceae bacterium]MDP6480839.1 arginine deiminase family protein [Acidimicrobiales bacterium]MDP6696540.1 arginine deiminase family protein [Acidimicrobiales bacterium]|tara:strand:- start:4690 stop:5646 length:957 start_codon:yes stop_codon:yes gene_type:complete